MQNSSPGQTIATYHHNIVGLALARSGQTLVPFERNIFRHCLAQHVARVWPPCCNVLRHAGYWKSNHCACLDATLLHRLGQMTMQRSQMFHKKFDHFQIWASNTLHRATCRNTWQQGRQTRTVCCAQDAARKMLRPTMLRYVPLKCCDHLAGALGFGKTFLQNDRCKFLVYSLIRELKPANHDGNGNVTNRKGQNNSCARAL